MPLIFMRSSRTAAAVGVTSGVAVGATVAVASGRGVDVAGGNGVAVGRVGDCTG